MNLYGKDVKKYCHCAVIHLRLGLSALDEKKKLSLAKRIVA